MDDSHIRACVLEPSGAVVCRRCGKVHPLAPGEVAANIAGGWPMCCGQEMRLSLGRKAAA